MSEHDGPVVQSHRSLEKYVAVSASGEGTRLRKLEVSCCTWTAPYKAQCWCARIHGTRREVETFLDLDCETRDRDEEV